MKSTSLILGVESGPERDAAEKLADKFRALQKPGDQLIIVAGAKCHGQPVRDVDLLVFGKFSEEGYQLPSRLLPERLRTKPCIIQSFAMVIEVKDHDASGVRLVGNKAQVLYRDDWKDVSEQAFQQMHSVRNFLRDRGHTPPLLADAVWLRGLQSRDLPVMENLLGVDATAKQFLGVFARAASKQLLKQRRKSTDTARVHCSEDVTAEGLRALAQSFTQVGGGTLIDRKKLEAVSGTTIGGEPHSATVGHKMLVFRGHGGTGKTMRLLRIAVEHYRTRGSRAALITYNTALRADLLRLLSLLGFDASSSEAPVQVLTSESLFGGILAREGLAPSGSGRDYENRYVAGLRELTVRLADPSVSARSRATLPYDVFLIDEAQDWRSEERDALLGVVDGRYVVVADGLDQFTTGNPPCDWINTPTDPDREIVHLTRSLRMKANICGFLSYVATELGASWSTQPDERLPGGEVVIVNGTYSRTIHEELMRRHAQHGNLPIDALFVMTGSEGATHSELAPTLESWGNHVWDGTRADIRRTAPRSVEQHRVVRYESSRGLEGWTVVCLDLDHFLERQERSVLAGPTPNGLESIEAMAHRRVGQWCTMAMTRAIDTLVVQVTPGTPFSGRLLGIAGRCSDFVSVRTSS